MTRRIQGGCTQLCPARKQPTGRSRTGLSSKSVVSQVVIASARLSSVIVPLVTSIKCKDVMRSHHQGKDRGAAAFSHSRDVAGRGPRSAASSLLLMGFKPAAPSFTPGHKVGLIISCPVSYGGVMQPHLERTCVQPCCQATEKSDS